VGNVAVKERKLLESLRRKLTRLFDVPKPYRIGRFELLLSGDHLLDRYQRDYRLTDTALGEIVRLAAAKYPDLTAVDIGANVGDTAAVMCRHRDIPVLCIEGHPAFVALLRRNVAQLPAGIEIAECLIGPSAGPVSLDRLRKHNGTATLRPASAPAETSAAQIPVRPLADVLREHPRFARPRLIKTDTDGADFDILLSSLDVIGACRPILHFEYKPDIRPDGMAQSVHAIAALWDAGYTRFLVYDNFGNYLETVERDAAERFRDLNRYLLSHAIFGRRDIHYLDVCAFAAQDEDLAVQLRDYHRRLLDEQIGQTGLQA
jgi:FkbM family methyltransferase